MTPQFLRALQAEINASPACAEHVHTNDMPKISGAEALAKDQAIADIINVGRTRPKAFEIGKGTIVEVLGLAGANAFLDIIDGDSTYRHVKHLLQDGRLRVDSALVEQLVQGFIQAGVISANGGAALLALGREPDPVTAAEVSRAVRGPWGDEE